MTPDNQNSPDVLAFRNLTSEEMDILLKLASEEFPGRVEILNQLSQARGKKIDEEGSLFLSVSDAQPAPVVRRIPVEAQCEDADGVMVHVLLHVLDGYIAELEIYREDSGPLLNSIEAGSLEVIVL